MSGPWWPALRSGCWNCCAISQQFQRRAAAGSEAAASHRLEDHHAQVATAIARHTPLSHALSATKVKKGNVALLAQSGSAGVAVLNSLAGYFFVHTSYSNVDLVNDDKLVWTEGNTTYVLVRTANLPLLDPLRYIGLGFVADALNAPLKKIVDSAYNRDYPGVIADPTAAQKAVDDALRGPAAARSTAPATGTTALAAAAAKTAAALVTTASSTTSPQPVDAAVPTASAADSADDVVEPKTAAAQAIKTNAAADSSAESEVDSKADAAESDSDAKTGAATTTRADLEPAKATETTASTGSNGSSSTESHRATDSDASGASTSAASS